MGCAGHSWAGRAVPWGVQLCSLSRSPGIRNAATAGNARLHLGLRQTLSLQRMLGSQRVSKSAKTGDKGLMGLRDVQKEKQSRTGGDFISLH